MGVFLIFLVFCVPGMLFAGIASFFTTYLRTAWIRVVVRAALVSIAIAPSEDAHGSLWPAIWVLIAADHVGLRSLLITWMLAVPIVYAITRHEGVDLKT